MVLFQKMGLDVDQVITVEMDQFTAIYAFAVEAYLFSAVAAFFHEFKAGRIIGRKVVFVQDPFIYKLFQLTVNGGLPDRASLGFEVFADVGSGKVFAGNGFEVGDQTLPLFGFVFRFCIHYLPLSHNVNLNCRRGDSLYTTKKPRSLKNENDSRF